MPRPRHHHISCNCGRAKQGHAPCKTLLLYEAFFVSIEFNGTHKTAYKHEVKSDQAQFWRYYRIKRVVSVCLSNILKQKNTMSNGQHTMMIKRVVSVCLSNILKQKNTMSNGQHTTMIKRVVSVCLSNILKQKNAMSNGQHTMMIKSA